MNLQNGLFPNAAALFRDFYPAEAFQHSGLCVSLDPSRLDALRADIKGRIVSSFNISLLLPLLDLCNRAVWRSFEMARSIFSILALAASALAFAAPVKRDSWGGSVSLGPTKSHIINAVTTLIPGVAPSSQAGELFLWPGMSVSLLQSP